MLSSCKVLGLDSLLMTKKNLATSFSGFGARGRVMCHAATPCGFNTSYHPEAQLWQKYNCRFQFNSQHYNKNYFLAHSLSKKQQNVTSELVHLCVSN